MSTPEHNKEDFQVETTPPETKPEIFRVDSEKLSQDVGQDSNPASPANHSESNRQEDQQKTEHKNAQVDTDKAGNDVGAASDEHTTNRDTAQKKTAQLDTQDGSKDLGQVTAGQEPNPAAGDPITRTRDVSVLEISHRFMREGRWKDIEPERNEMMKLARKRFKDKKERQHWVYGELDRMYPPLEPVNSTEQNRKISNSQSKSTGRDRHDDGQIQGLGEIPQAWPELPANASLASEVGWVQANRLRIVKEQSNGATVVHLDHALSPAPSWAALGWLETSIRSYAKYVDVAARATASDDGEASVVRRERMAIGEVDALLDEMRGGDRSDV
jgi:hypothetical protein